MFSSSKSRVIMGQRFSIRLPECLVLEGTTVSALARVRAAFTGPDRDARFHTNVSPAVRASNSSARSAPSAVGTLSTVLTGPSLLRINLRLVDPLYFE